MTNAPPILTLSVPVVGTVRDFFHVGDDSADDEAEDMHGRPAAVETSHGSVRPARRRWRRRRGQRAAARAAGTEPAGASESCVPAASPHALRG